MFLSLTNATHVFIFIIFSSIYVCSILWIYGDAATRGLIGWKGTLLPLLFLVAGTVAMLLGYSWALLVWPIGFIGWFVLRPAETTVLTE